VERVFKIILGLILLALGSIARADGPRDLLPPEVAPVYPYPPRHYPPHWPNAVFVFTPADRARLEHALRGTPYHAAFRRAKVAKHLSDGAVPGLVPVVIKPRDADRLWRELDWGRPVGLVDGHLRDVLHATVLVGWSDPDAPRGGLEP
jgi:hypothetical protein